MGNDLIVVLVVAIILASLLSRGKKGDGGDSGGDSRTVIVLPGTPKSEPRGGCADEIITILFAAIILYLILYVVLGGGR